MFAQYLHRPVVAVIGLFIAWAGHWMFFHPEKTLKKIYSDLISSTRFSNIFFRIFATMWILIGLWMAFTACVPNLAWNKYPIATGTILGVLDIACTFFLVRRSNSPQVTDDPNL